MKTRHGWILYAACAALACQFTAAGHAQCELEVLLASDRQSGDNFGIDVATEGDRAIVGAWQHNHQGAGNFSGAAYAFERIGADWVETQEILASNPHSDDNFGQAVAMSGNFAIISAPGLDNGGIRRGGAYIFELVNGQWTERAILTPDDPEDFHVFGFSVDIWGDEAAVGAWGDSDGGPSAGAAYIFRRNGSLWQQEQKLVASDAAPSDRFGSGVAIEGARLLIGATGGNGFGKAYIFERTGATWDEKSILAPGDPEEDDFFGWRVALRGGTAFIGAFGRDAAAIDGGAVFVFTGSGADWAEQNMLFPATGTDIYGFGQALEASGDRLVVGALNLTSGNGQAHIWRESNSRWTESTHIEVVNGTFGQAIDVDAFAIAGAWSGRGEARVYDIDTVQFFTFTIDPDTSVMTLELQFPDQPVQVFTAHMTGRMLASLCSDCVDFATLQVPEFQLRPTETSFDVIMPDGSHMLVTDVQVASFRPGAAADLVPNQDRYEGTLEQYEIELTGVGNTDGDPAFSAYAILDCVFGLFYGGNSPGQGESTITFPGIDFSAELDMGLGKMNPTLRVTGEVNGSTEPPSTPAELTDFSVERGALLDGELADLVNSDDQYVHTRSGFGEAIADLHKLEMIVNAVTAVDSPALLDLTVEARIDQSSGVARLFLRNRDTDRFDQVAQYGIGMEDASFTIEDIDATNYVGANGEIDLMVKHNVFRPFLAFTFESFIDRVEIRVK